MFSLGESEIERLVMLHVKTPNNPTFNLSGMITGYDRISYEGVPETPCIKPPKSEIQFFGGSLDIYATLYSVRFSIVVRQYAIVSSNEDVTII